MAAIATRTQIAVRAAGQGGIGMTVEGFTEVIQETIAEYAAAGATDTEVGDLTNKLINAFAVGAFGGLSIGASTSAGADLIQARSLKQSMDQIHLEEKKSLLRQRRCA